MDEKTISGQVDGLPRVEPMDMDQQKTYRWVVRNQQKKRQLWPAASTRYSTASPLIEVGALNCWMLPPVTIAPGVAVPVEGSNHSTFNLLVVAVRSTVNAVLLFGWYTRYSAPLDGVCARQNPVDVRFPCGVIFAKSILFAYVSVYPRLSRKLLYFASGPLHTPFVGEAHRLRLLLVQ